MRGGQQTIPKVDKHSNIVKQAYSMSFCLSPDPASKAFAHTNSDKDVKMMP
jgi:hypothetical protein